LKILEKINRKAIRNSRKKEKPIQPQPAHLSLDLVNPSALLSLSLSRGPDLSALVLLRAPALSLCLAVPTCQPSLTSRPRSPAVDAPTTARSPATSEPPRPARPPPLAHLCPLPSSLALSLALSTRAESPATAPRRSPPVLRTPSRSRHFQCHGELCLTVSCSGHPSVCPFPPWFNRTALAGVILAQLELRRRRPSRPYATTVAP
jgi:hypothetical protein